MDSPPLCSPDPASSHGATILPESLGHLPLEDLLESLVLLSEWNLHGLRRKILQSAPPSNSAEPVNGEIGAGRGPGRHQSSWLQQAETTPPASSHAAAPEDRASSRSVGLSGSRPKTSKDSRSLTSAKARHLRRAPRPHRSSSGGSGIPHFAPRADTAPNTAIDSWVLVKGFHLSYHNRDL